MAVNSVTKVNAPSAFTVAHPELSCRYGEVGRNHTIPAAMIAPITTCHQRRDAMEVMKSTTTIIGSKAIAAPAPTIPASGWPSANANISNKKTVTAPGPEGPARKSRARSIVIPLVSRVVGKYSGVAPGSLGAGIGLPVSRGAARATRPVWARFSMVGRVVRASGLAAPLGGKTNHGASGHQYLVCCGRTISRGNRL